MSTVRRRMRSSGVTIGITALMATGLTGCSSSADYAAVCVDPETQERVDDDLCDDADDDYDDDRPIGGGFFWYYLAASRSFPSVGSTVSGGTYNASSTSGTVQRGGLSSSGGSSVKSATTKGGFGSGSSRGSS